MLFVVLSTKFEFGFSQFRWYYTQRFGAVGTLADQLFRAKILSAPLHENWKIKLLANNQLFLKSVSEVPQSGGFREILVTEFGI